MGKTGLTGWQIVVESELREASNGKAMVFGTAMDEKTNQLIPFVAFGETAIAVEKAKLKPHTLQFTESDRGDRQILGASIFTNDKGESVLV